MYVWRGLRALASRYPRTSQAFAAGCIAAGGDLICQLLEIRYGANDKAAKRACSALARDDTVVCSIEHKEAIRIASSHQSEGTATERREFLRSLAKRSRAMWGQIDKTRLGAVSLFGFAISGPVGVFWYPFIDKFMLTRFPHILPGTFKFVMSKTLAEGIFLGPVYTSAFFPCVSLVEGGDSWQTLADRMKRDYLSTFLVDQFLWLFISPFTYRYVPVDKQLIVTQLFAVLENMFLSWVQHQGFPSLPSYVGMEQVASRAHPVGGPHPSGLHHPAHPNSTSQPTCTPQHAANGTVTLVSTVSSKTTKSD